MRWEWIWALETEYNWIHGEEKEISGWLNVRSDIVKVRDGNFRERWPSPTRTKNTQGDL